MADRDLLNKLLSNNLLSEDLLRTSKPPPAPSPGKLGVKERPKEIGSEKGAMPLEVGQKKSAAAASEEAKAQPPPVTAFFSLKPKAYKAAYFNRDVQATSEVNPRARPQQALRGAEGAMDLRRVVLPAPAAAGEPGQPAVLAAALDRMQPPAAGATSLASLLGRQNEWSQLPSIKPEHILARLAHFHALVAFRREMLKRMARSKAAHSPTIEQALGASADAPAASAADVAAAGDALIEAGEQQGGPMRARLHKVMRVKS